MCLRNVSNQVEKAPASSSPDENGTGASSSGKQSTNSVPNVDAESLVEKRKSRKMYAAMAILALLVPILVAYLFQERLAIFRSVPCRFFEL